MHTDPAKIYFQWAQHDMYISRKSADEYFKAVGGPKEQKWYYTSHEFNDQIQRPTVVPGFYGHSE